MNDDVYIIFHIERTGGTSLRSILFYNYLREPEVIYPHYANYNGKPGLKPFVVNEEVSNARYIIGHEVYYGMHEIIGKPCHYVIFLRDPVARMQSWYNYFLTEGIKANTPFPDFKFWFDGARHYSQIRCLRRLNPPSLDEAKEILRKMAFIGLQETFDQDVSQLFYSQKCDINVNTTKDRALLCGTEPYQFSDEEKSLVKEAMREDYELYDFAKKLREEGHNKDFHLPVTRMILMRDVETDVTDVCNMTCRGCSHLSPFYRRSNYPFDQFAKDIDALSKVLYTHQFTLVGGEPFLRGNDLHLYIDAIQKSGISRSIRIITNGTLLHKYPEIIRRVDVVLVSIYPNKRGQEIAEWIVTNQKEHPNIEMVRIKTFGEYYTPDLLSDAEAQQSWDQCFARGNCNTVYRGKYYLCIGAAKYRYPSEGVDLHAPDLETRLRAYIENPQRLPSCSHCYGGRKKHEWTESLSSSRDIYNHEQPPH